MTGLQTLASWQNEIGKRFFAGESLLVFLPSGGGRILSYAPHVDGSTGVTLVAFKSLQRWKRRESQLRELQKDFVSWKPGEPWPSIEQGLILTLEEYLDQLNDSVENFQLEKIARIVLDGFIASHQVPEWWEKWGKNLPNLMLPSHTSYRTGWWTTIAPEVKEITKLIPPQEELELSLDLTDKDWTDLYEEVVQDGKTALIFGRTPPPYEGEPPYKILSNLPQETSDSDNEEAQIYFLSEEDVFPLEIPSVDRVILDGLPMKLRSIGIIARTSNGRLTIKKTSEQRHSTNFASEFEERLYNWLLDEALRIKSSHLYSRSSELLKKLGLPTSPQVTFENNAKMLDDTLQHLVKSGLLLEFKKIHTQVKIHRVHRFSEEACRVEPKLSEFWKHYSQMQDSLSPLQAISMSLLSGRTLDLLQFSQNMPFSIAELNEIFALMDKKGLIVQEQLNAPSPHMRDEEYQIDVSLSHPLSPSVQFWWNSGEKRTLLLWATLSQAPFEKEEELQELWNAPVQSPKTWKSLWSLVQHAQTADRLYPIAGRILAYLDHGHSDAALLLWELISAALDIPGIPAYKLIEMLPKPCDFKESFAPALKLLLEHHADTLKDHLTEYILELSDIPFFQDIALEYLEQNIDAVLALQHFNENPQLVQHYINQASNVPLYGVKYPWFLAVGWAYYLQGHIDKAVYWFEKAPSRDKREKWYRIRVLIAAGKGIDLLDELEPMPTELPASEKELREARTLLFEQCFALCKEQSRCKQCSLYKTAYCPESPEDFQALKENRPEESIDTYRYRLVKRIRCDFHSQPTSWLRQLLEENDSADLSAIKVRRIVWRTLADRNEAELHELRQLAQWYEKDGDWRHAMQYRQKLKDLAPDDAENLHALAHLKLRKGKIREALKWALEATHSDPKAYPLEPFIEENKELFLSDLDRLKKIIIDLPAHPALSALEAELLHREEINKKLLPKLDEVEALYKENKWEQALKEIEAVLAEEPELAPLRFRELKGEILQRRQELIRSIRKVIRNKNPKIRNKNLEEIANEALKFGFKEIALRAYRTLLKRSPHYGLGHLKFARLTPNKEERNQAYVQAISLARNPEHRHKNLKEFVDKLDAENDLRSYVSFFVELAQKYPDEYDKKVFEPIFLRIINKYGVDEEINKTLSAFIKEHPKKKELKKLQSKLHDVSNIDPWKRQLLAIKISDKK